MFGRPRCREWTPLATQQLRLRSLIQIVGYNIRPPESCAQQYSFYITLHHTTMSAPFYTSERISSPHPKWKEIDSEITQRMSSTNVVIRIWCHELPQENVVISNDTIIQTWGVYFSGLRYIGANLSLNFTSDCFKSNTLVFQMHGGYFCSYKSLKLDVIPHENEIEHGSLSSDSSGRTNLSSKITLEAKFLQNHRSLKESRSVSPSKSTAMPVKEYSKSQSPVEGNLKQHVPVKTSSSLNIHQRKKNNQIYEHSPETLEFSVETSSPEQNELSSSKIDLSETAENYDLRSENDWVPKYRYLALSFLKSEIRPSYNVVKLQKLHLLQYSIKKRQEAMQELKERIYKKSALQNVDPGLCDQYEIKPKFKSRSQKNLFSEEPLERCTIQSESENGRVGKPNGPRLTLKLNDLLSIKSKPSPYQISEHVRLTKQLEILRFKRIILSDERDAKLANIRRLKEIYCKLCEENQDIGSELMQGYHALSRRQDALKERCACACAMDEMATRTRSWLMARRKRLLGELLELFDIRQQDQSWTIVNTPLPISSDDTSPSKVSDSVAAGFVAQCLTVASAILDQPLRYRITLMGSASKIMDVTPDLPDPNIPLFARGGDVTLFRYGMFLLNKCVAQLLWARGHLVADMRPTLANVRTLLTTAPKGAERSVDAARAASLRSLVASERGRPGRQFNRFKDCVEGQPPHTLMSLRHRHSRSVGSCQDVHDLPAFDTSTTSTMGSEPNIYNTKLTNDTIENLKTHNSDSEISKIGEKVFFTLGADEEVAIATRKLVKMSTNNENECNSCIDENVKRICSEINSFCSQNDDVADMKDFEHEENVTVDQNVARSLENDNSCVEHNFVRTIDCNMIGENNIAEDSIKNVNESISEEKTEEITQDIENIETAEHVETSLYEYESEVKLEDISRSINEDIQNIDIVKHMEAGIGKDVNDCDCLEIETQDLCEVSCANMIKDVIVIQSAEARFDSGQGDSDELK